MQRKEEKKNPVHQSSFFSFHTEGNSGEFPGITLMIKQFGTSVMFVDDTVMFGTVKE